MPSVCATSCAPVLRRLARRPDLELAVLELRRAVLRLERRVRDERIRVGAPRRPSPRRASAASTSPSLRSVIAGRLLSTARPPASRSPRCSATPSVPSSQVTFSLLRAPSAPATSCRRRSRRRGSRPLQVRRRPSTTNACFTPGSALISSRFALTTLPPNTGHFSNTAYSMPGSVKSMPKSGLPVTIVGVVDAAHRLADDLEVLRILQRAPSPASGSGSVAAFAASSP